MHDATCYIFFLSFFLTLCLLYFHLSTFTGFRFTFAISLTKVVHSDMEFLEVLTEGLERVLMVRGGGREVITIYS